MRRIEQLRRVRWAIIWLALGACTSERPLRFGTTHTVQQSGALDVVDSLWNGPKLAVVVAGSGQILRSAADGNLDVVLTHAPSLEARFMDVRHAELRCPFVASRFAVVGPPNDPAHVALSKTAEEAFRRIGRVGAVFVTRGDSSGTHVKELSLWRAAGIEPSAADWYIETGADQAANLRQANEWKAYALVDLPTFVRQQLDLVVLFANDTVLTNPYTLYVVRAPEPAAARTFAAWAMDTWRARLLERRLPDGSPAFASRAGACAAPAPATEEAR